MVKDLLVTVAGFKDAKNCVHYVGTNLARKSKTEIIKELVQIDTLYKAGASQFIFSIDDEILYGTVVGHWDTSHGHFITYAGGLTFFSSDDTYISPEECDLIEAVRFRLYTWAINPETPSYYRINETELTYPVPGDPRYLKIPVGVTLESFWSGFYGYIQAIYWNE